MQRLGEPAQMFQRRTIIAAAASLLFVAAAPVCGADTPSPNDTARFLAGMPPASDSAFGRFEQSQLARIRAWSSSNLTAAQPTMFYMFSGPDFLYANAFYPKARTYVLSGLE